MYDPVVEGKHLTFDVLGLVQDVFTMTDRETGTVWNHLDGRAVRGPLEGKRLTMVPAPQMTWGEWRDSHPDTVILSPDTPFQSRYRSVRIGVFNPSEALFGDDRLAANALVVRVEVEERFKGYPIEVIIEDGGVVSDILAGQRVVVIYDCDSKTGIAYSSTVDGQELEFYNASSQGFELRDKETNSLWDHQGRAIAGPLAGTTLEFVPSFISEWYGWSAYHPETLLFGAQPQ